MDDLITDYMTLGVKAAGTTYRLLNGTSVAMSYVEWRSRYCAAKLPKEAAIKGLDEVSAAD
jgi:hypothetical protein